MNKIKIAASVLVACLLMVAIPVAVKSASTTATAPQPPKPGSSFAQRLAQRKAERNIVIKKQDIQRVKDRCTAGQTKLRTVINNATSIVNNHLKIYNQIDAKLWVTIGEIKLANQDTFSLEKVRTDYVDLVSTFKTTSGYYKQALNDTILVKCQSDPVGFKALLETSRLYYANLRSQVNNLHNYVVNTISKTLGDYSDQLQPQLNSSGQ